MLLAPLIILVYIVVCGFRPVNLFINAQADKINNVGKLHASGHIIRNTYFVFTLTSHVYDPLTLLVHVVVCSCNLFVSLISQWSGHIYDQCMHPYGHWSR